MIDNKKLKSKYEIIQLRVNDLYWALSHDDHYKSIRLTREIRDVARDLLRDLDDLMEEDDCEDEDLDEEERYDGCSVKDAMDLVADLASAIQNIRKRGR